MCSFKLLPVDTIFYLAGIALQDENSYKMKNNQILICKNRVIEQAKTTFFARDPVEFQSSLPARINRHFQNLQSSPSRRIRIAGRIGATLVAPIAGHVPPRTEHRNLSSSDLICRDHLYSARGAGLVAIPGRDGQNGKSEKRGNPWKTVSNPREIGRAR